MTADLAGPAVDRELLESWTPRFHVTAERHWLNDPNGLIQVDGTYHVFFQENPLTPFWGAPHWGHVSSRDLVTWQRHERALSPVPGGPDRDGCWSGCARVVDGVPYLYYTGVVGDGADRVESVCRAAGSADLRRWTRDPANPLVPGPPAGAPTGYHRDPFLWRDGDGWHLALASGGGGPVPHGTVLVYDSPDARTWSYAGVLFAEPDPAGAAAEHWECPQLLVFGDSAVLVVSVQRPQAEQPLSHVEYFVGDLVGTRFHARHRGRLDGGDALYAPAVTVDDRGRALLWGWAQEALDPGVQRHLPVAGALTLPRLLTLEGDELRVDPAPELTALRTDAVPLPTGTAGQPPPAPAGTAVRPLPAPAGAVAVPLAARAARQLVVEVVLSGGDGAVEVRLTGDGGDELRVTVTLGGPLEVTVTGPGGGARTHRADTPPAAGDTLTVHRDGSLVEVFHAGRAVTTRWYATTPGDPTLTVLAYGGAGCHPAAWTVGPGSWLPAGD